MKEIPILQSRNSILNLSILFFGGIAFLAVGIILARPLINAAYPSIFESILTSVFIIIGAGCLLQILLHRTISIYTNRVVLSYIFGYSKTIDRSTITAWKEKQYSSKYNSYSKLILYTSNGKIRITSSSYSNYDLLSENLIKGKKEVPNNTKVLTTSEKKKDDKKVALVFVFFACCFFAWAIYDSTKKVVEMSPLDLAFITDAVSEKPYIVGGKGSHYIRIKLKNYPDFKFDVDGVAYKASAAKDFVNNTEAGDTITLDIKLEEYEKKIEQSKPLSYFDKSDNYEFISVYGLSDKDYFYLSLVDYNAEKKSDNKVGIWGAIIAGLFFIGAAIYDLKTGRFFGE